MSTYHVSCKSTFSYTATISNTFGVGEGPTLLFDTTCNRTNSELSQCVHPESIGLRGCISQDKRAGVICPELAFFSTTTISPSVSYTLQMIEPSTATVLPSHSSIILSLPYPQTNGIDFSSRSTSSTDIYSTTTLVLTTVSTQVLA